MKTALPYCLPVAGMSTKSCYQFLLSENMVTPHCVEKFAPTFGALYWPTTWNALSFFDMDRQVIDLNWKIAHGVLYTAERLVSFGLSVPLPCFCGAPVESLQHLFFFFLSSRPECVVLVAVPYVFL